MTATHDLLDQAVKFPRGATFWRCALQVNPHKYLEESRGQAHRLSSTEYRDELLRRAARNSVRVIGVADHDSVESVEDYARAAAPLGITVFPGFEVKSHEGVHVVCLFEPGTSERDLVLRLGKLDVDPKSDLSRWSLSDVLRCVIEDGGVAYAAHATSASGGLFRVMKEGNARAAAWRDRNLLAIQIPGPVDELPPEIRQILLNENPEYQRSNRRRGELAVAVLNARDVVRPEDLDDELSSTLIKMTRPSVEALRQAFLDPESRIRRVADELPLALATIEAIAWQGGFLDQQRIHFNENLNVLVGGRGSGKSTVIESIRFALGLQPRGERARRAHEDMVAHVLQPGTKIALRLRVRTPVERTYTVERTSPNPPVLRDDTGAVSTLSIADLFPAEIYGQHEIAELAVSLEQVALLQRFVANDAAVEARRGELRRALAKSRALVLETMAEIDAVQERLDALPGIRETLKRYQDAGIEEKLREQALLVREERVLRSAEERVSRVREPTELLRRQAPDDVAFLSEKALAELPGREILADATPVLQRLAHAAQHAAGSVEVAQTQADAALREIRRRWEARKRATQAQYESVLRELQKTRVDTAEYLALQRQAEELGPLEEKHQELKRRLSVLRDERVSLLREWEDIKAARHRALETAAERVRQELRRKVRITLRFAGDRRPLYSLLEEKPGGNLSAFKRSLDGIQHLSIPELVEDLRTGSEHVAKKYAISLNTAERLTAAGMALRLELQELDLPSTMELELNIGSVDSPEWRKLDDLSAGQKATALLLIILLESEGPLLVDQPEDDLDNRFIFDAVVPRMREEKRRRQFVFATHNANIPVLGDAELIVGLVAGAKKAKLDPDLMGSIDTARVRHLVEELLEGGEHAFRLRKEKYDF